MKKKKNEIIAKYFSDLMTDTEKFEFEKKLQNDEDLKLRFDRFQNNMKQLSVDENVVDDRYFSSLLPRVRQKIDVKVWRPIYNLIYPLSGIVTTLLIFLIATNSTKNVGDFDNFLVNEDDLEIFSDESLTFMFDSEFALKSSFIQYSDNDSYIDNILNEKLSSSDADLELMELPIVDEFYIYSEIGTEDLEEIYTNINEIDFFEGG